MKVFKYSLISIALFLVGSFAYVYLAVVGQLDSHSTVKATQIEMHRIAEALDLYYTDCGKYPPTEIGLHALVEDPLDRSICEEWGPNAYIKTGPYWLWVCGDDEKYELLELARKEKLTPDEVFATILECLEKEDIDENYAKLPRDAWGRHFKYKAINEGKDFHLTSFGYDGVAGGDSSDKDLFYISSQ